MTCETRRSEVWKYERDRVPTHRPGRMRQGTADPSHRSVRSPRRRTGPVYNRCLITERINIEVGSEDGV